MINSNRKMKESVRVGALLAATAGFIDSYTFAFHDGRLASFQSGNMLQFGVYLARGNLNHALIFIWPALAFFFGAMFNQVVKRIRYVNQFQWEEFSILFEILGITVTAILEIMHAPSVLILSLLAISMALQTDTFTKLHGAPYVTTMFTGNLKRLGVALASYGLNHQSSELTKARNIGLIIASFLSGVVLATFVGIKLAGWALFLPVLALLVIWLIITADRPI
ncbi:DUF1275 domain-containing protein [Weissella coleopterorum]|uniref:DUF1275 domain-containing protein n=1 Tax=Weissella coleopterorum TaxID=2714949 RepID=A0A6G8AYU7_9LACO|nr:YoaK family protein [Weissella coleopterorum]QIL50135.1 DUF1275 domain-containing protein [Weissella coleopterorum]